MGKSLRFASDTAYVEVPQSLVSSLLEGQQSIEVVKWADEASKRINTLSSGVLFRIGKLRLDLQASRIVAHAIADVICKALQRSGAPGNMSVEIDRPQVTAVMPNLQVRTLLPHHDGGHCSYLTPSVKDDRGWRVSSRRFSSEEGYSTTQAHKLYQGIFITEPGEGLSVTTYYDLVEIVSGAYIHATGHPAQSIEQLATWLGRNIQTSLDLQSQHKSRYLTLGAALGGKKLVYHGMAVLYAEDAFPDAVMKRFPELREYADDYDGSGSFPPVVRFMNEVISDTMGLSWEDFRAAYEVCLSSERFDFVLGHNLALLHGGLMGGRRRLLEPICMVVEDPSGEEYENWLAQAWRRN